MKHSQLGPCSSGCWEEELLLSCCRGEFPVTLKCPRKRWKQNEAWQWILPGRIVLSDLCPVRVRITVSSGLSYAAEEIGPECVWESDLEFLCTPSLPQFRQSKACDTEKPGAESRVRFDCLDLAVVLILSDLCQKWWQDLLNKAFFLSLTSLVCCMWKSTAPQNLRTLLLGSPPLLIDAGEVRDFST